MLRIKLKGGALYISIIISILISIVLSLFILIAYYNTRTIQTQNSLEQLQLSIESSFAIAQSDYYQDSYAVAWQKLPYNNDSVKVKKTHWGSYTLVDVNAKNSHFNLHQTGLYGGLATRDTALFITEQNRPIGLAGKIKFNGFCYLPKSGIKSAYIEGTSFSDLNSLKPFIKNTSFSLPQANEKFLKQISRNQNETNPFLDSLLSFVPNNLDNSFHQKTAVVQLGSLNLSSQKLKNNIKIISSNVITVDNTVQLENVLLIARKVIFKKKFKGTVHVIAQDSIIVEENCEFNYPSSFCVYHEKKNNETLKPSSNLPVRGMFFGESCKFNGGLLAINNKENSSKMMVKLNKHFEMIGNIYSSNYCDLQGNIYGSVFCQSLLLQTPSAVYENHLLNCLIDSKKYGKQLVVPNWFEGKQTLNCAKKL